jgi:hypothetical protein
LTRGTDTCDEVVSGSEVAAGNGAAMVPDACASAASSSVV